MIMILFKVMAMMVMKVMCAAIKSERGPTFMMMAVVTFVITEIKSGKTLSCAIAKTFIVCDMRGTLLINEDEEEDDHDPDQSDDDHDDREGATKRLFFLQLSNFSSLP